MYFLFCAAARMAELVDARDLKSLDWKRLCEFKSRSGHHILKDIYKNPLCINAQRIFCINNQKNTLHRLFFFFLCLSP